MSQTHKLTEPELDAVCGGRFAFLFASPVTQANNAVQVNAGVIGRANFNRTRRNIDIG
jgi:hypothetical protein